MDQLNTITFTPDRERGQHLKFEDRCSIKIYQKLGYSLRKISEALNCSPSTIHYELQRGTGSRNGDRGRFPEYSPKRGQKVYEINRSRCHKEHKILKTPSFLEWVMTKILSQGWSLDACVGRAKKENLFSEDQVVCTKTLYNELWAGNLPLTPFDLPEALSRKRRKGSVRKNKRLFGKSIEERPEGAGSRTEAGHWEIDTVIGKKAGRESVVLTLLEKKTEFYIALQIPHKDSGSVMAAMEVLREEFGAEYFKEVFKTITSDNGGEFERLSELESWGAKVYFAHPYSSWERGQNERHNRILRKYIPKGKSVENYSAEQILWFADEINSLPRRTLGYATPEELFDSFLDQVYSLDKVRTA